MQEEVFSSAFFNAFRLDTSVDFIENTELDFITSALIAIAAYSGAHSEHGRFFGLGRFFFRRRTQSYESEGGDSGPSVFAFARTVVGDYYFFVCDFDFHRFLGPHSVFAIFAFLLNHSIAEDGGAVDLHIKLECSIVMSDSYSGLVFSIGHVLHDPFVLVALVIFFALT